MYCQVDYKLNNYFYSLTAYDLDYCDGDYVAIEDQLCAENDCDLSNIEILWDTLVIYEG